jgi:disulfide oxidoreductase YuzD
MAFKLFGLSIGAGKQQPRAVIESRSYDVPDKVFVEREGPHYEWSIDEPAALRSGIYNLLNGFYSNQNFVELFYSVPEVFAPVHEIASRVADCNFQLRKSWNDEVDYNDADFNRLFTQPNPLVSFKDFVYQAVCYEILTGRQLFFFNRPDLLADEYKSIIAWWNLPSHKVHVELKKNVDPYTATSLDDFVIRYRMPLHNGNRYFDSRKVLPLCHLSLNTGFDLNDCKSHLLGAEKAIRNLIPVYEARGVIYIKRGAMGFIVSRKGDASGMVALTPAEKKATNLTVNESYGLQRNKSTIGVIESPVDFIKTSMSIQEMQPFEETLADAVAIYKCLRIPRHLVPSKDTSTYANADADMKSFYSDVIIPMAKRYAEAWTNYMKLETYRRYIHADFSHVDVLQENRKEKADVEKVEGDTFLQRFMNGVCTLNDWVVATGNPKVSNPLYDKKIFEMDETELATVKAGLNMKAPAQLQTADPNKENDNKVIPLKPVANG